MPKKPIRVFIVHETLRRNPGTRAMEPVQDFSSAQEYGELVHVFGQAVPQDYEQALPIIQDALAGYTQDDYLIFVGDPALIAMAAAMAVRATGGPVRWLTWDKRIKRYSPNPPIDFYSDSEKEIPANG